MAHLRKVISGGQTGADHTGLVCARQVGLETGGTCPKGCHTDDGPNPELVTLYGLTESSTYAYAPRTVANVKNSQATLWFGDPSSPGGRCTRRACSTWRRPFIVNPAPDTLRRVVHTYEGVPHPSTQSTLHRRVVCARPAWAKCFGL
jgi:hypothetical protein